MLVLTLFQGRLRVDPRPVLLPACRYLQCLSWRPSCQHESTTSSSTSHVLFLRCNAQLAADMEAIDWASTCSIVCTLDGALHGGGSRINCAFGEDILINAAMPVGTGSEIMPFEQNRRQ